MISISEVINISVSTPPAGLAEQNVCNLLCMTKDVPVVASSEPFRIYTSATDVATDWGSSSNVAAAANAVFAQAPNIISGGGKFIVTDVSASSTSEEKITEIVPLVFFGGFATTFAETDEEIQATAVAAKAAGKIFGVASSDATKLEVGGLFGLIKAATLTNTRCLFHSDAAQVDGFKWGYLSRAMSVNFAGNNTTNSMQLKQIAGVVADSNLNQTVLNKAKTVGVDVYPNIAGRSSVLSYGTDIFFDEVFNVAWLKMALEIAGFNVLAETQTKIPQTEAGMSLLKGGYREVCKQAISNAMAAPGTWTSSDTFGNPEDFLRNISEQGYYIFSQPVNQQSSVDRAARKAPLVQIALKLAGAVHSSNVIVNINR